jgi:hypothetical protein
MGTSVKGGGCESNTITLVSGGGAISVNGIEVSVTKWLREGAKLRFIKT